MKEEGPAAGAPAQGEEDEESEEGEKGEEGDSELEDLEGPGEEVEGGGEGEGVPGGAGEGQGVRVKSGPLSAVARDVALRLGALLGWRGVLQGAGGKKAKKAIVFAARAQPAPSEENLEAAHALCAAFVAGLSGEALAEAVARLKDLRKSRHAKKAAESKPAKGKLRFVSMTEEEEKEEEEEGGVEAAATIAEVGSLAGEVSARLTFVREGCSGTGGEAAAEGADSSAPALAAEAPAAASKGAEAGGVALAASGALEGLGEWEAHSKGFGAKMLLKMGFSGSLGKAGGGASAVVKPYEEVKVVRGKPGLGASAH